MHRRLGVYAIASLVTASALVFFVFPGFAGTYTELGTKLPEITQVAIDFTRDESMFVWGALFVMAAASLIPLLFVSRGDSDTQHFGLRSFTAAVVAAGMTFVSVFFLAAIVTPMFNANS